MNYPSHNSLRASTPARTLLALGLLSLAAPLPAAIDGVFLVAEASYTQQPGSGPTLEDGFDAFGFAAFLDGAAPTEDITGNLSLPGGGSFGRNDFELDEVEFGEDYPSVSALQADAVAGTYTLNLNVAGTNDSISFNFPGLGLPPAPNINNLTALQSAPQSGEVTISWNAWGGANAETDRIGIYIWRTEPPYDDFYEVDVLGDNPILGTATSTKIPAGVLQPGKRYGVTVEFIRIHEVSEGVAFLGGTVTKGMAQVSSTEFYIQVAGTSSAFNWSISVNDSVTIPVSPTGPVSIHSGTGSVYYNLELRTTGLPRDTYTATFTPAGGSAVAANYGWREDYSQAYVFGLGLGVNPVAQSYTAQVSNKGGIAATLTAPTPTIPAANTHRVPKVLLAIDAEGYLTQMDWDLIDPTTGNEAAFPDGVGDQGIEITGTLGQSLYSDYSLDPMANSLFLEFAGILYDDIGTISHFYTNAAGNRHNSRIELVHEAADPAADYFLNTTRANATWLSTPVFGWFADMGFPWVYHLNHGFIYCAGAGQGSYYLYDAKLGWFFTSDSLYQASYLYSYNLNGWIMYLKGTTTPGRWFYYNNAWVNEATLLPK